MATKRHVGPPVWQNNHEISSNNLSFAAANGNKTEVLAALQSGANVNERSRDGMAPLCIAAFWGFSDIADILLRNGADVNATNAGTCWTPCHCAAFQGHGKVLMKLMEYRPNLSVRDSKGRMASDFASALDSIWPIFAAAGCRRTPKAELIRLDIVQKINSSEYPALPNSDYAHFSRPGSAYAIRPQPLNMPQGYDTKRHAAAISGDVLAGVNEERYSNGPSLHIWQH